MLKMHIGPLVRIWMLPCLLQLALCSPVLDSCWDCLSERNSISLASDPVIKGLTFCNPKNVSAALAFLSIRNFDASVFEHYSSCRVFCGEQLYPLLLGEIFEVSARAIMKCALRSLSAPAVAYSLRAYSLRCMLAALRVRKPYISSPAIGRFFSDAVVYMGPPHNLDLRGKRGPGNWAEFKLSLQHLKYYWPSAAFASLVILHEGYGNVAKQELRNAAGRPVVFHEVNLTAAFWNYSAIDSLDGINSFGLGYRGMCRMMSGPVFLLPPLKHIDRFFVRLDADSHITRPVTKRTDALDAAAQGGQVYVFWWLGHNCSHMHDIARAHLLAEGADFNSGMHSLFRSLVPSDDAMRALYFQTNFEIVRMKFARSQAFQGMFNAFDGTEGFLKHRFGDANVRFFQVLGSLQKTQILQTPMPYCHGMQCN